MAWIEEERKIAFKLVDDRLLYKEISEKLEESGYYKSPECIRAFLKSHKDDFEEKNRRYKLEQDIKELELSQSKPEDIQAKFQDTIDKISALKETLMQVTTEKFSKVGKTVGKKLVKVLSLSDLHIPFENEDVLTHAIENHGDADILVLNGDIFEMYAVSKWPKSKEILVKWEYKIALEWLKVFSRTFKEVHLVSGNHEHRLQSYFSHNILPVVDFLVSDDILSRLAKGYDFNQYGEFTKVHTFKNVRYTPGILNWYTQIGKCIFAHPRSFSSIPMRTVINAANSFLDREDYQAMIIGHSHRMGKLIWRNRLLIEQGCCCVPLDYESDGKLKMLPQAFGYAVVYMDEYGNVDFDKTNPVYIGTGHPVKTDI